MVFLKLMGLMDILSVIILVLFKYGFVSQKFLIIAAIYLMLKGVIFFKSVVSIIDFGAGVIFILVIFGMYNVLTWVAIAWIIQKAIFSMVS